MGALPRIHWVIPAYNEAASIVDLIHRIAEVSDERDWDWDLTIVDDGSTDGTGDLARQSASERSLPVTVLRNEPNQGLGRTIRRGLRTVSATASAEDFIITLDADLTQDPGYAPAMVERLLEGYDVVIASRYQPGAAIEGLSEFRRALSRTASVLVAVARPIKGVRDYSCGFRAYRASAIQEGFRRYGDDLVSERGFACMLEIAERLREFASFSEVPFVLHYQEKRKASEIKVMPTIGAYVRVIAKVASAVPHRPESDKHGGEQVDEVSVVDGSESGSMIAKVGGILANPSSRFILPSLATSLMYVFTRHYLVYFQPQLQLVLLSGLVLSSCASDWMEAAVGATCLAVVAMVIRPAFIVYNTQAPLSAGITFALGLAVGAGLLAAALVWAKRRIGLLDFAAAALALLLVFGNMIATADMIDTQIPQPPFPPMYQYLKTNPVPGQYANDTDLYLRAYNDMHGGMGYYNAFRDAFAGDTSFGGSPTSPLNYRMPTVFLLWKLQPFGPIGIPRTLLALDFIALAAFAFACLKYMRPGAAIAATTGLAAYLLYFLTTEYVLWVEAWAVPFVIASIAAAMLAEKIGGKRLLLWSVSAACAALAMLVREQFLLLGIAGLVAALLSPELRSRRVWLPWVAAIAAFFAIWGTHAVIATSGAAHAASSGHSFAQDWLHGGPEFLQACVLFANRFLSQGIGGPVIVAILGVLGIVVAPKNVRLLVGAAAVEGLLLLSVFGNEGRLITGARMGYWGVFLMPYLFVGVPFLLAAFQSGAEAYRARTLDHDGEASDSEPLAQTA